MLSRYLVWLVPFVLSLAGTGRSHAFTADNERWTSNRTVVMHLSLGGPRFLQDGSTSFNQVAAAALNAWNQHLVHLQFSSLLDSQLPKAEDDASNSVFFANSVYGESFGSNTVAITLTFTRENIMTETDVIFNDRENWDSYRGPRQFDIQDFYRVALHEFGHVIGLSHPNQNGQTVAAIMNSTVGNQDTLTADDINGGRSLYASGPEYRSTLPSSNLVNLSTRAFVGTGERVLIGGFIVEGSQPATMILRAIGVSLGAQGISNPLRDPVLELRNAGGTLVAEDDDWIDGVNATTIASYGLDPSNSRESALFRTLNPGSYTVLVRAFDNSSSGTALVELFDLHATSGRAGNISSRGNVRTGNDIMIAGFIVGGPAPKELVVRGRGPSLRSAGIADPLSDPEIQLVDGFGNTIALNDDWEMDVNAQRVRDAGLAPSFGEEAALYINASPGAYTALLRGFNNATGIALVEVYDLSPVPN